MFGQSRLGRGFDSRHLHHPSLGCRRATDGKPSSERNAKEVGLTGVAAAAERGMVPSVARNERRRADGKTSDTTNRNKKESPSQQKAQPTHTMHYAYILRSLSHPDQRYIGSTSDLRARLAKHNAGQVPHTSKFLPWKVETYIAFETLAKAQAFERYLKSGSGHAFAAKHF